MKEILIKDFEGMKIGNAENVQAGTGCTVLLFGENGAPAGLDVRGGGPASRESELLKPLANAQIIHAILLSGGSAFGLDAAGGVMRYLEERDIGFDVGVTKVPLVCQSCLFDLTVGDVHTRPGCIHGLYSLPECGNRKLSGRQLWRWHRCNGRKTDGYGTLHEVRHWKLCGTDRGSESRCSGSCKCFG